MLGVWGWRQPGEACELQTTAEETHQGWPTPVGGSPRVLLKVYHYIMHRQRICYVSVVQEATARKLFEYWYLQPTCQGNVELKVVAELKGGEVCNK